jgi:hypothetical protein
MCVLHNTVHFCYEGAPVIWVVTDGTLRSGYLPPLADKRTNYLKGKGFNPSIPVF